MNRIHTLAMVVLFAVGAPAQDHFALLAHTKISMGDAIASALEARPGHAAKVELEADEVDGTWHVFFEIAVVTSKPALFEVKVDAVTGKVTEVEECEDRDELEELAEYRHIIRNSELTITQMLAKVAEVVRGHAVEASLEIEDGQPACEVILVNSRYRLELVVEARAGHLVDIEMMRDDEGHRENGEHEDENGEHEDRGRRHEEEDEDEDEDGEREHGKRERKGAKENAKSAKGDEEDEDDDEDEVREHVRDAGSAPRPIATGVVFSPTVAHPYFPLSTVRLALMEGGGEKVIRRVLDEVRVVGRVPCTVMAEEEYEGGKLVEISYNYFAQDGAGNVWYFGEDVDDYEDGKIVGHGGAWKVGTKGTTEPCLFLPAKLEPGFAFKPENSPPDAEEFAEIVGHQRLEVAAGAFGDVLVVREADQPGKWKEKKYYARGVGLISENGELNLVRFEKR